MSELDAYFDAYDRVHVIAAERPDWKLLRRQVRRAMVRPVFALAWRTVLLIAFIGLGVWGEPTGYMLALGTLLAVIPRQIREIREARTAVAELSGTDELRKHLEQEARRRLGRIVVTFFIHSAFAIIFLLTGGVAALLGKDFRPGLIAGLLVAVMAVAGLLIRLPRASRDSEALRRSRNEGDTDSRDEHDGE